MNKYFRTYEEWEQRIKEYLGKDFKLVDLWYDDSYNGRKTAFVEVEHMKCGNIFIKNGYNVKHQKNCPKCISDMQVSELHAIISLIFKHYYPNAENEKDIGFRGDNGGISRYDLFVPDYNGRNLIIEFQSKFHDGKEDFDRKKRNFAISNGYSFYAFDAREHKALQVIKKFFPEIKQIPEWVYDEVHKYSKYDLAIVQELLNKCYTAEQIENETGISKHVVYSNINKGVLKRNPKHYDVVYNKSKIVLLNQNKEYIGIYRSLYMIEKHMGIKVSEIKNKNNCVLKNGYYFIYEKDYINKNYKIPK